MRPVHRIAALVLATALGSSIPASAAVGEAPGAPTSTHALAELRRAHNAMLTPEEAPYAGAISWRSIKPDSIEVVDVPWDEAGHACSVGSYAQEGGQAFRQRWLVSETPTTYDASVAQDVVLFPDAAAAAAAFVRMSDELATCQQRLQEQGSEIMVTPVGDVTDAAGEGTVWNADFPTSEPEFLEDVTMAALVRGRAVSVVVVSRYGTLASYDPASALPTAQAALTRLAVLD